MRYSDEEAFVLRFPNNFEELKLISKYLNEGYKTNPLHVTALFSSAYLFKQTFAVPGSVFLVRTLSLFSNFVDTIHGSIYR